MQLPVVLIIEDHPIFAEAVSMYLQRQIKNARFKVLLSPKSFAELNEFLTLNEAVKIIILDMLMPNIKGIEIIGYLETGFPEIKIIVNTAQAYSETLQVRQHGNVFGVLNKSLEKEEMILAVKKVLNNMPYNTHPLQKELRTGTKNKVLSDIEINIVKLIRKGYSTKSIAEELRLKKYEVDYKRKSIAKKTNTKTLMELERYCIENYI